MSSIPLDSLPRAGSLVEIKFYDHWMGVGILDTPLLCFAYGEFVKETDLTYLLRTWNCPSAKDNDEFISIIKSCVLDIKFYREDTGR